MFSARRCTLVLLACMTFGLVTASASFGKAPNGENHARQTELDREEPGFGKLLSSASSNSLHELLHAYFPDTYKHGVYPSDESAVEAVHSIDAALATSLVELAKRQNSTAIGTVGPATTHATTPSQAPATTTETATGTTPTTVSVSEGTTVTQVPTQATTTAAAPASTETTDATITTTAKPQTTDKAATTLNTPSSASTESGTTLATITSAAAKSSSSTTFLRTSTWTSTGSDGALVTMTSTATVTGAVAVSGTATHGSGNLQTNVAVPNSQPVLKLAMGVIIGGALLA